eukprot:scaffold140497_cov29-Tisochrysis_lutea.AAC.2
MVLPPLVFGSPPVCFVGFLAFFLPPPPPPPPLFPPAAFASSSPLFRFSIARVVKRVGSAAAGFSGHGCFG